MCAIAQGSSVVRIQPIIAHLPGGTDLAEIGAGGGGGDLEREAELDLGLIQDVKALTEMFVLSLQCTRGLSNFFSGSESLLLMQVMRPMFPMLNDRS